MINSLLSQTTFEKLQGKIPLDYLGPDIRQIYHTLEYAHKTYGRDIKLHELRELHFARNPTMVDEKRESLEDLFAEIPSSDHYGADVAFDLLDATLLQDKVHKALQIAVELGKNPADREEHVGKLMSVVESMKATAVEKESYDVESFDVDDMIESSEEDHAFKCNLPPLAELHPALPRGAFVVFAARPETGKTSFHAHLIAGPKGYASQGYSCHVLVNEEAAYRVRNRYATAFAGVDKQTLLETPRDVLQERLAVLRENVHIVDVTGWTLADVERYLDSQDRIDVVVCDILDKIGNPGDWAREDMKLKSTYMRFRDFGKPKYYDALMLGGSQVGAEGEGKLVLNMSMLDGSKTGKAGEADVVYMIAKSGMSQDGEVSPTRYINIAKDKAWGLTGRRVTCMINPVTGRYSA